MWTNKQTDARVRLTHATTVGVSNEFIRKNCSILHYYSYVIASTVVQVGQPTAFMYVLIQKCRKF